MKQLITLLLILLSCNFVNAQETPAAEEGIDSVRRNKALIYLGFGVGLVRNTLSPAFYINVGYRHANRYEANVNTCSYFFFEKENSKYNTYRNTFLNAEFILNFSPLNNSLKNWNGVGVGYLIESRGEYFAEPAMVFYYKRKYRFFSVMPGIVFDDNFKDVWPVISIRL
jgi:hypothetical protein